jgi:hypothetical protein
MDVGFWLGSLGKHTPDWHRKLAGQSSLNTQSHENVWVQNSGGRGVPVQWESQRLFLFFVSHSVSPYNKNPKTTETAKNPIKERANATWRFGLVVI